MPARHHSVYTGRMPFLTPNQQRQSTGGNLNVIHKKINNHSDTTCLLVTDIHKNPHNGHFSTANCVSQKGKASLDFNEAKTIGFWDGSGTGQAI